MEGIYLGSIGRGLFGFYRVFIWVISVSIESLSVVYQRYISGYFVFLKYQNGGESVVFITTAYSTNSLPIIFIHHTIV